MDLVLADLLHTDIAVSSRCNVGGGQSGACYRCKWGNTNIDVFLGKWSGIDVFCGHARYIGFLRMTWDCFSRLEIQLRHLWDRGNQKITVQVVGVELPVVWTIDELWQLNVTRLVSSCLSIMLIYAYKQLSEIYGQLQSQGWYQNCTCQCYRYQSSWGDFSFYVDLLAGLVSVSCIASSTDMALFAKHLIWLFLKEKKLVVIFV